MSKPKSIDLAIESAYLATSYCISQPYFCIKIGQVHPGLDEFLIDNDAHSWAFISAYNPYSKSTSDAENEANHLLLIQKAQALNLYFVEGKGKPEKGDWLPEKSLFILGASEQEAIHLGKVFQQNAIVVGAVNQKARLIWCVD